MTTFDFSSMTSKPGPSRASIFHPQNQGPQPPKHPGPQIPTMVNPVATQPLPQRPIGAPADELGEDIVAKPLSAPEFACDIQGLLANQSLAPRWVFTDLRRYSQAKLQGYRNCTKQDLKPGIDALGMYEAEGGTKYINGDLILMLIDRKRYLGALRHKHEVAARLAQPAVQRAMSARKAYADMGSQVAGINRQRVALGQPPVMSIFDPSQSDINQATIESKDAARLGHEGKPDMFSGKSPEGTREVK